MRQPRPDPATRVSRFRAPMALVAALALAGGCQSSATPLPPPSPTQTAAASTAASASATPIGSQSTAPSGGSRWEPAGSTAAWRRETHAALLSDKRVLLVGPVETEDGAGTATTAELWDPATGAWTASEALPKGRTDFVAVPLSGTRVLVAGGLNAEEPPQSYSSAYVYDAAQGTWAKTGLLAAARTGASAAMLPDGRVLVAGGYFYQPDQTGSIDPTDPTITLAAFRSNAGAGSGRGAALQDVDPGVAGAALATAEVFDPAHGTWSATSPLHYARYGAAATTLADGRVLIVGSAEATRAGGGVLLDAHAFTTSETYDPATGKFTLSGALPKIDRAALEKQGAAGANPMPDDDGSPGDVGTLVALPDGGAVLIAQTRWWKHVGDLTRSFRFDAASGVWSEIGQTYVFIGEPGPVPLWTPGVPALVGAFAAALPDGRVLVAGGSGPNRFGDAGGNQTLTSAAAQVYDPAANAWSALPPMPEPRAVGAAVVLADGSVLLVNGTQDTGSDLNQLTSAIRFVP